MFLSDLTVFSRIQPIKGQVHDPDSLKCLHLISKIFAHPAYLTVQPLRQNDLKTSPSGFLYRAGSRHRVKDRNTAPHALKEILRNLLIYCHKIFFLMIIPCTHDPVHEIALIRQKQQPFRILIQPSDRIDTQRIIKVLRHRRLISLFLGAADDPSRLVKQQKDFLIFSRDRVSVQADYCIC